MQTVEISEKWPLYLICRRSARFLKKISAVFSAVNTKCQGYSLHNEMRINGRNVLFQLKKEKKFKTSNNCKPIEMFIYHSAYATIELQTRRSSTPRQSIATVYVLFQGHHPWLLIHKHCLKDPSAREPDQRNFEGLTSTGSDTREPLHCDSSNWHILHSCSQLTIVQSKHSWQTSFDTTSNMQHVWLSSILCDVWHTTHLLLAIWLHWEKI